MKKPCSLEECTCLDLNDLKKDIKDHVNEWGKWTFIPPYWFALNYNPEDRSRDGLWDIPTYPEYDTFLQLKSIELITKKLDDTRKTGFRFSGQLKKQLNAVAGYERKQLEKKEKELK